MGWWKPRNNKEGERQGTKAKTRENGSQYQADRLSLGGHYKRFKGVLTIGVQASLNLTFSYAQ